jgi:hypothetical protein
MSTETAKKSLNVSSENVLPLVRWAQVLLLTLTSGDSTGDTRTKKSCVARVRTKKGCKVITCFPGVCGDSLPWSVVDGLSSGLFSLVLCEVGGDACSWAGFGCLRRLVILAQPVVRGCWGVCWVGFRVFTSVSGIITLLLAGSTPYPNPPHPLLGFVRGIPLRESAVVVLGPPSPIPTHRNRGVAYRP